MNHLKTFYFLLITFVFECVLSDENSNAKYIEETETLFKETCEPQCIFTKNLYSNYSTILGVVKSEIIDLFPRNCAKVCAEIIINQESDLSEEQLTSVFQNMKHLVGSLNITNTEYQSGKFFGSLETLECGAREFVWGKNQKMIEFGLTNLTTVICNKLTIQNNQNIFPLNMPNLKSIISKNGNDSNTKVTISGSMNPILVTTQEVMAILSNPHVDFEDSKLIYSTPTPDSNICNVDTKLSFGDIPEGCTQIFGNLRIGKENEHLVNRLKTVEVLFGDLYISKTRLENIDFFDNLKYIFSLEREAINVEYNANLTNFSFPSLKRTYSYTSILGSDVIFWQNNKIISRDPIYCNRIHQLFNLTAGEQRAVFDGKTCDNIKKEYNSGMPRFEWTPTILILLIIF